jgi:hypothetical protein
MMFSKRETMSLDKDPFDQTENLQPRNFRVGREFGEPSPLDDFAKPDDPAEIAARKPTRRERNGAR